MVRNAALQLWQPMGLCCRCGSREAAPQVGGQGSELRQWGCAAMVSAERLHCRGGSQ